MTTITLDTNALNALFPEGSQSRVDLRQAVIQNFVDRNFIRLGNEALKQMVKQEVINRVRDLPSVKDEVDSQLSKMFEQKGWNNTVATPEFKESLHKIVREKASENIELMVQEAINSGIKSMESRVKHNIERSVKTAEEKFMEMVSRRLVSTWGKVVDGAIKMKLGWSDEKSI